MVSVVVYSCVIVPFVDSMLVISSVVVIVESRVVIASLSVEVPGLLSVASKFMGYILGNED